MAKPAVDRLENSLGDEAQVIRLNIKDPVGMMVAKRSPSFKLVPALIIFDPWGSEVYHWQGQLPNQQAILEAVKDTSRLS